MQERHQRDKRREALRFRLPWIQPREPNDLDLEEIVVVFVDRRTPRPQRSVLTDDVLADLELAWKAEILNVALRLGRVQAEQGFVASPTIERCLREVLDGNQRSLRSRELPDDPSVNDLVGHRSRINLALSRLHRIHASSDVRLGRTMTPC
jgi:hypothetical protein